MTFLLSEDKALRQALEGLVVHDQKADSSALAERKVGVWFGMPDQEIRSQNYPYMVIDLIDVSRDTQREMRGLTNEEYLRPSTLSESAEFITNLPIPVNIDYQVTTYARHPRHDRELLAQLMSFALPIRMGVLSLDDNTVRRMDVLDISKRDMVEAGKRLFMNAFTVRVSSEISPDLFKQLYKVEEVFYDRFYTLNVTRDTATP